MPPVNCVVPLLIFIAFLLGVWLGAKIEERSSERWYK